MTASIHHQVASLKFMVGSFTERLPKRVNTTDIHIDTPEKRFDAVLFKKPKVKTRGTVIIINGFSAWGYKDPRMMNVGKHFANIRFNVIAPSFGYLNDLVIDPTVIDEIATVIKAVSNDKELCPDGKVSVFAPSYTAGMTLIACSRQEVSHLVKAVCSIGAYANIETSIDFILKKQDVDDYGRMVVMKNFLPYEVNEPEILEAIDIAIKDNGLKRSQPLLPAHLNNMKPENRALFERLNSDAEYRVQVLRTAFSKFGKSMQVLTQMNVVDHVERINAKVCLIHGQEDNVIPASESRQLHQLLAKYRSKLVITPLLSHGDMQIGVRIVSNVIDLMRGFSFFIRYASA